MSEVTRNKLSDVEVLRQYYHGERQASDLTEHQKEKRKRIDSCYHLLLDAQTSSTIVEMLVEEFGLSKVQAYRDITDTEVIWGPMRKGNKEMKRQIAENMALEAFRRAKQTKDSKAMTAAAKAYTDASGVNQFDPELPDFGKMEANLVIMVVAPEVKLALDQMLAGGAVNLNNYPEPITEDIDHEEVDKG